MPAALPEGRRPGIRRARTAAVLLAMASLAGCRGDESAIARGDRLWADSSYAGAVAEYRLAAAQDGNEEALRRLAHALALTGSLDETRETYARLLERSGEHRDQAVYDFLRVADRALRRNDLLSASVAMDEALALRPELVPEAGAREIAEWFEGRDQTGRALAYYRRALAVAASDSAPILLYRIGLLEEEQGRCAAAIDYLQAFQEQAPGTRRYWPILAEARWHTGNCSFELAMAARASGNVMEALEHLDTTLRLGVPESRLDRAWFERGELLLESGSPDEALEAFRRVLERNPSRAGRLVEQAQQKIDEIRFGGPPPVGGRR